MVGAAGGHISRHRLASPGFWGPLQKPAQRYHARVMVDPNKLEQECRTNSVGFPSFFVFWIGVWSCFNFVAPTVGPEPEQTCL